MKRIFYHFVYDKMKPEDTPVFTKFHRKAIECNLVSTENLGKGQIALIRTEDTFKIISDEIIKNPFFLRKGKQ